MVRDCACWKTEGDAPIFNAGERGEKKAVNPEA